MVKNYVCIPRGFLVINVCNQGKTLCSPCVCIQKGVGRNPTPSHWNSIDRRVSVPPKLYRPTVFFRHISIMALSFTEGQI